MRAATITSLVVLGLSTAAIAGVAGEGQRTRHHRSADTVSNTMNSTDMSTNTTMNMPMAPDTMNGTTTPDGSAMTNGM